MLCTSAYLQYSERKTCTNEIIASLSCIYSYKIFLFGMEHRVKQVICLCIFIFTEEETNNIY